MRFEAALYVIAWIAFSLVSGAAIRGAHCIDLHAPNASVYAALSVGPHLPIPALQSCRGSGAPVFVTLALSFALLSWLWIRMIALQLPLTVIAATACITSAIAIFFPYVSTTDAYAYALYAYEAGVLHLSPYAAHVLPANDVARSFDALFPTVNSDIRVMNYGPVVAFTYGAIGAVFGKSLTLLIFGERLLSAVCVGLTAFVFASAVPQTERRRSLTALWLSPLLLVEGVGFTHGDVLMLLFLAAAYAAFKRNAWAAAGVLIALAAGTRSVALLAAFAAFAYLFKTERRTALFLSGGFAVTLGALGVASFLVFGTVSFGGGAALDPFGSPIAILVNLFGGVNYEHSVIAAGVQAAAGFTLAAIAIVSLRYDLIPFAALAAVPALRPWYCQWIVPLLSVPVSRRARNGAWIVATLAILGEAPLLIDGSLAIAGTAVAIQWAAAAFVVMNPDR